MFLSFPSLSSSYAASLFPLYLYIYSCMQSTIYQNMLVFSMSLYVQHNNNALFPSRCCYAMYVSHFTSPSYIAQDGRFQPIQKTTLTRNPEKYAYWLMLFVGYCELVVCSVTITNKYINE